MIDIQPTIDMQSYSFFSDASKRVFRNLPFGHSEEISKSSFWMLEKNNFLMHIGCGEYQSRAPRVPMHLQFRAAPFGIFGDEIMKHNDKVINEAVQNMIGAIRRIPNHDNAHAYQISVRYYNTYGARLEVFPSEFYTWWGEYDLDDFRCLAIAFDWHMAVHVINSTPVIVMNYHI